MVRAFIDGAEVATVAAAYLSTSGLSLESTVKRTGSYSYSTTTAGQSGYVILPDYYDPSYTCVYFRLSAIGTSGFVYLAQESNVQVWFKINNNHIYMTAAGGGTAEGSTTISTDTWYRLEVYLDVDDTSGRCTVKINGSTEIDYTGDTQSGPLSAYLNRIYLGASSSGNAAYFDDIAVNDTTGSSNNSWIGDHEVVLIKPNGNGNSSQFMGSDGNQTDNYLLVDEVPNDGDTTYVYSSTASYVDLYALSSLGFPPEPTKYVVALVPFIVGKSVSSGSGKVRIRSGTTEDTSDSSYAFPNTVYRSFMGDIYETDPNTSSAWTVSAVEALQAGPEMVSGTLRVSQAGVQVDLKQLPTSITLNKAQLTATGKTLTVSTIAPTSITLDKAVLTVEGKKLFVGRGHKYGPTIQIM